MHTNSSSVRASISSIRTMEIIWVVACCIVVCVACSLHIRNIPLWSDELVTIITAQRPLVEGLFQLQDYAAPMYQMLLRPFIDIDYPAEWIIRTPAVIFATFGLFASWWFSRMLFGAREAMITVFLLAVNPFFLTYAMEGRPYSLFLLFSVLSMGTFYCLVNHGGIWTLTAYVFSTGLLIYSHHYGFLVLPAQAGYALTDAFCDRLRRRRLTWTALGFGVLTVVAVPALWLISRHLEAGAPGTEWLPKMALVALYDEPGKLLGRSPLAALSIASIVTALWWRHSPFDDQAPMPEATTQKVETSQWWTRRSAAILCVLWIASSLYLLVLVSRFFRPVYFSRYGLPVIVPLTALLVAMICRLRISVQIITLMLVLGLIFHQTVGVFDDRVGHPQLVAWLKKVNQDESPVFVTDWPYCEGFINPEVYGLRYYGYPEEHMKLLPLRYPYRPSIRDTDQLPTDRRFFTVSFIGSRLIEDYLKSRPRAYRVRKFGHLTVFEAEKEGSLPRWLE